MKKKFMVTLLSLTMAASMLTGCGSKTTEPATPDKEVSTEVGVSDEDTKDNKETAKDTKEDKEEKDVKQDHNYTAEDITKAIDSENFGVSMTEEGFTMTMMTSGEDMLMEYSYFLDVDGFQNLLTGNEMSDELQFDMDKIEADGGYEMTVTVYKVDGDVYCYSNVYGTDKYMKMVADDDTADGLFDDMTTSDDIGITEDSIADVEYIDTIDYKGTTVDVVNVTSSDDDVVAFYINPKTGLVVAMAIEETDYDGKANTVIVDIYSDKVILPSEFKNAEEVSADEIMGNMMGIMFLPMYSMEYDVDISNEDDLTNSIVY